ncbi:hypothetical protein PYCCODRAFT_1097395 [Trametes coccinea BRFM310]|uniref:Uncharacterized protein n=1 Tax=Trametes coccinea (strain BRFM310) TaxID=1353009 RepID=A0A1Y2I9M9_TRAC3|nr:hypothetical protein PYCCODRAFT_1097395 [Trametes coccinea BRFM310]
MNHRPRDGSSPRVFSLLTPRRQRLNVASVPLISMSADDTGASRDPPAAPSLSGRVASVRVCTRAQARPRPDTASLAHGARLDRRDAATGASRHARDTQTFNTVCETGWRWRADGDLMGETDGYVGSCAGMLAVHRHRVVPTASPRLGAARGECGG